MNQAQIEAIVNKTFKSLLKSEKDIIKLSMDKIKLKEKEITQKEVEKEKQKTIHNFKNTRMYLDLPIKLEDYDKFFEDKIDQMQTLYDKFLEELEQLIKM
jgi:hypothetical protein